MILFQSEWQLSSLTSLSCRNVPYKCSHDTKSSPWTCVWYTTKNLSFPQLSNSSPGQRLTHMSSFSGSWREKREVGKPQWHLSPAKTANDFSCKNNKRFIDGTGTHEDECARHEPHSRWPPTLSVHMSTHLSTDMFWMTALKGRASVTLSGRWKHPLKMALPSEETKQSRILFTNGIKCLVSWLVNTASIRMACDHWSLRMGSHQDSPLIYWSPDMPADCTTRSIHIPAVWRWPLAIALPSDPMDGQTINH